jgi:Fur family ferric uptake transcriptional regulator
VDRESLPHLHGRPRATRQRAAVVATLAGLDGFSTVQEIHDALMSRGDQVALTTVYRTVQALAEASDIDALIGADGQARYRRCGQAAGAHHHLVCRSCGLTVIVEGTSVDHWASTTAEEYGFTNIGHAPDLFGLCPECSAPDTDAR